MQALAQERVDALEAHVLGRKPDGGPLHQRAGGGVAHLARKRLGLGGVAGAQQLERLFDRGGIAVLCGRARGGRRNEHGGEQSSRNRPRSHKPRSHGGRITPIAASYGPTGLSFNFLDGSGAFSPRGSALIVFTIGRA